MTSLHRSSLALVSLLALNYVAVDAVRKKYAAASNSEGQSLDTEPRTIQGSNSWWSCGDFSGEFEDVQTVECPGRTHCCCLEGYLYDAGFHRCSKVTTTTTTEPIVGVAAIACSAVSGAVPRNRASWQFWLSNTCKCPASSVIKGDHQACQYEAGKRHFNPDALKGAGCFCEAEAPMGNSTIVKGSKWWWSCGLLNGVQTKSCHGHQHCCCVDGYDYKAEENRCAVATTTITTTELTLGPAGECNIPDSVLFSAERLLEQWFKQHTQDKEPLTLSNLTHDRAEGVEVCPGPVHAEISANLHGLSNLRLGPMSCRSGGCLGGSDCAKYLLQLEVEAYIEGSLKADGMAQVSCGNGANLSGSVGLEVVKPSVKTLVDLDFQVLPPQVGVPQFKNIIVDFESKSFACKFGEDPRVSALLCTMGDALDNTTVNKYIENFQKVIAEQIIQYLVPLN